MTPALRTFGLAFTLSGILILGWSPVSAAHPTIGPDGKVPSDTIPTTLPSTTAEAEDVASVIALERRPWSALAAVALAFPTGFASEPDRLEGGARLLAGALETEGNRRLQAEGAEVRIALERDRTVVTLLTPHSSWHASLEALESLLFRLPVSNSALEDARASMLERLAFEEGAPVRSFELEKWRMLVGATHPGARVPEGSAEAVRARTADNLEEFRTGIFDRSAARAAIVGPLSREDIPPWLESMAMRGEPAPASALEPAWATEDRQVVDRDVTNTWIAMAFPAPPDASRTMLEFLSHILLERLAPTPPDPGLLSVDVRVEELPDGPVILVRLAVDPRTTDRWERRVRETLTTVIETEEQAAFFQLRRRRFRSEVLHRLSYLDQEAERLALDLFHGDGVRDLEGEIWSFSSRSLRDAAGRLGPPRTLLYGPARMFEGL